MVTFGEEGVRTQRHKSLKPMDFLPVYGKYCNDKSQRDGRCEVSFLSLV